MSPSLIEHDAGLPACLFLGRHPAVINSSIAENMASSSCSWITSRFHGCSFVTRHRIGPIRSTMICSCYSRRQGRATLFCSFVSFSASSVGVGRRKMDAEMSRALQPSFPFFICMQCSISSWPVFPRGRKRARHGVPCHHSGP